MAVRRGCYEIEMLTFAELADLIRSEVTTLDATLNQRVVTAAATEFNGLTDRLERLFDDLVADGIGAGKEREMRHLVHEIDDQVSRVAAAVRGIATYELYDGLRAVAADCDEEQRARRTVT